MVVAANPILVLVSEHSERRSAAAEFSVVRSVEIAAWNMCCLEPSSAPVVSAVCGSLESPLVTPRTTRLETMLCQTPPKLRMRAPRADGQLCDSEQHFDKCPRLTLAAMPMPDVTLGGDDEYMGAGNSFSRASGGGTSPFLQVGLPVGGTSGYLPAMPELLGPVSRAHGLTKSVTHSPAMMDDHTSTSPICSARSPV